MKSISDLQSVFRVGAVGAWAMLSAAACGGEAVSSEEIATISEAVVGGTAMMGPSLTAQGAVGLLCSTDPNRPACCTGTLAMNNFTVLTAAHCICSGGNNWRFSLPSQASIPANELGLPPMCFRPTDTVNNPAGRSTSAACWDGSAVKHPKFTCDSDMSDDSGSDLAVVSLSVGVGATTTTTVPATLATPQPVYLGPNYKQFLNQGPVDFFDGFGAFHEAANSCGEQNPPDTTEFVRRQMASLFLRYEDDPCDQAIFEGACHHRPTWLVRASEPTHTGHGDSGGALFAPRPGTGTPTIIGALHGRRCRNPAVAGDTDAQLWAMTADPQTDLHDTWLGQNRVWLGEALKVGQDFGPGQAIGGQAALYASLRLKINDRATVVADNATGTGAVVAATPPAYAGTLSDSILEIRNDVQTGSVIGGGVVQLFDRISIAGNLSASVLQVIQGTQTVSGTKNVDSLVLVKNIFDFIHVGSSNSNTPISIEPGSTQEPVPGSYGNVSVKRGGKLFLSSGTFKFKSMTIEPGAIVSFITPDEPTYIVVNGTLIWRGSSVGDAAAKANILWAVGGEAFIGHPFAGTIVAPNGKVTVDTDTTFPAVVGAILAQQIEVHQGRQIRHRPFLKGWSPVLQ